MSAVPKYSVCSPVKHDGKKYAVGASITLSAKAADQLVADGVLDDSEDRAVQEQAEARRLAAKQAEAERHEAARVAAEQAEAQRLEAERAAADQAEADAQRREAERLEQERMAAEQAEADRRAQANDAGVQTSLPGTEHARLRR